MKLFRVLLESFQAFLVAFLLLCQIGCTSNTRYCEGTCTQIGLYIPVSGQIYGLQCLNYLNGCVVNVYSNQTMTVERECTMTNSYFGCIDTVEYSKTKINVK